MPIIVESGVALNYLRFHPDIETGSVTRAPGNYVISLKTLCQNWNEVYESLKNGSVIAVEKTDEGIETLWHIVKNLDYAPWIRCDRLRFITASDSDIVNLNSEHFLKATIGSQESLALEYTNAPRPYTFLFTNRKIRPHRRYLIMELQRRGLLGHALWSCLHPHNTWGHPELTRVYEPGISMPVKTLDTKYEPCSDPGWIDGIICPTQYQDTWFTLVSETGFEYPHSYRTEKTWKPILAGHPFIICANFGFYRDLHNLGFKTFDRLIDESFDSIIDGKSRLQRLIDVVEWLCAQDLAKFWQETRDICLYNQQRAQELHNSQQENFTQSLIDFMYA